MRAFAFVLLALTACSAPPPPPPRAAEPPAEPEVPRGEIHGGSLPPAEVKVAIATRRSEFRACYHRALEQDRTARGKVVLRITVGEDGTVQDAVPLHETTLPPDTAHCIANVVRSVRFPKPVGGPARITYPWVFDNAD